MAAEGHSDKAEWVLGPCQDKRPFPAVCVLCRVCYYPISEERSAAVPQSGVNAGAASADQTLVREIA